MAEKEVPIEQSPGNVPGRFKTSRLKLKYRMRKEVKKTGGAKARTGSAGSRSQRRKARLKRYNFGR